MKSLLRKMLWRTFLLVAYCMFGSWLFHYVEKKPKTYHAMSAKMLDDLHRKHNIVMNHSEFMEFANGAYEAFKLGKKVDWTFLNASSYLFSILTTIGYGHMTPETMLGQLLTVLYSVVGLPISMLALKTFGEVITSGIHSLVYKIEKRLFKTRHAHKIKMTTFLVTCLLMILFLLLGTVIQVLAEDWNPVQSIYTWFIVFSTIGFGDYIPFQSLDQKSSRKHQKVVWIMIVLVAFFTLAGLCVVSAVLTSLAQAVEEYNAKTAKPAVTLIQFVKKQRNRVSRSEMYTVNHEMEHEEQGQNDDDLSLENYRRVRSKSV